MAINLNEVIDALNTRNQGEDLTKVLIELINTANHKDNIRKALEEEYLCDEVLAEHEIELGTEVFDEVTGFRGIVITKCEYFGQSTARIEVQPRIANDGEMSKAMWFDATRLIKHIGEDYE